MGSDKNDAQWADLHRPWPEGLRQGTVSGAVCHFGSFTALHLEVFVVSSMQHPHINLDFIAFACRQRRCKPLSLKEQSVKTYNARISLDFTVFQAWYYIKNAEKLLFSKRHSWYNWQAFGDSFLASVVILVKTWKFRLLFSNNTEKKENLYISIHSKIHLTF